jgi:hypothetical protein
MVETNAERRADIAGYAGFSIPSGAFRKDQLNVLLDLLGGDACPSAEVYGAESWKKAWFYRRVAAEAGFDYDAGEGEDARPYNADELDDLRAAVEDALNAA